MATDHSRTAARIMISPAVLLLLAWMIVPLAMTLYFSFLRYNLLMPGMEEWIGFDNYVYFFDDPAFKAAIVNTLVLVLGVLLITVVGGTLLALLLRLRLLLRLLRASLLTESEWNERTRTVKLRNARFELFGMPIAYLPYLEVPDFDRKRKSGFLTPSFGTDDALGTWARVPYFLTLGPSADVTIETSGYTNQGFLLDTQFRKRFENGIVTLLELLNSDIPS